MNIRFKTKDIKLAELKYFDKDHGGMEYMDSLSLIFVAKVGDEYVNLLNICESYQTYERVPYSNTTNDGEDFGTMISLVSGVEKNGPCWLLTGQKVDDLLKEETVSIEELEDYVLNSRDYFKDRYDIAFNRLYRGERLFKMLDIINKDITKKRNIDRFFDIKAEKQFMKHRW